MHVISGNSINSIVSHNVSMQLVITACTKVSLLYWFVRT